MRKVTMKAAEAMRDGYKMRSRNTEVTARSGNVSSMFLHGNCIAVLDHLTDTLTLYSAGWLTATTKERLNGILQEFGSPLQIKQRNFTWFVSNSNLNTKFDWTGNLEVTVL
jgi:hypothetical protein